MQLIPISYLCHDHDFEGWEGEGLLDLSADEPVACVVAVALGEVDPGDRTESPEVQRSQDDPARVVEGDHPGAVLVLCHDDWDVPEA